MTTIPASTDDAEQSRTAAAPMAPAGPTTTIGGQRSSAGQWARAVRALARLVGNHPVRYLLGLAIWIGNWVWPMALGFIGQAYFDLLDGVPGAPGIGAILGALAAWMVVRLASIAIGMWQYAGVVFRAGATLQRNMLSWLLARPGAQQSPLSTGEIVSRFRDDVEHTEEGFDGSVDVAGAAVVGLLSFAVLARIDLLITSVMFLPLVATVALVAVLGTRIASYRTAARDATEHVTGFLGEAFGAVQSVKVAGAEASMLAEFGRRNDRRRSLMVRDRTLESMTDALGMNMVNVATGVVLLMAAGSLATPQGLDVGEFALFTYLIAHVGMAAWHAGMYLAQVRQAGVSVDRMLDLVPDAELDGLTRRQPLEDAVARPRSVPGARTRTPTRDLPLSGTGELPMLSVRGLTHLFTRDGMPGVEFGIRDVDLDLHRGQFVVVTGRVAAGKTTLLRTLLGLLPAQAGTIAWKGRAVDDPATFMVPPVAAYTPQVPRLFSMSLRDNLAMGADVADDQLHAALAAAAMGHDLATMPAGLDTLVGSRGTRLSGGQVQRAAAARMLVRDPALLVIDDVSSALDVDTEAALWDRLFRATSTTALVVSHRRPALRRADLVLVVEDGRIVDRGTADELLERSAAFRGLWG